MRTIKKLIAAIALGVLLLPLTAFAVSSTVSSTELIEKSKEYNGRTVDYTGEVIGDLMIRGDHAWVNVNDGSNAMGIWITVQQAADINNLGCYDVKGDEVRISGVFERACKEHGGDMDIHATTIEVLAKGHKLNSPIGNLKAGIASVLFIPAVAFVFVILKRRI